MILTNTFLAFIPLFVAVDAIGVLPIYVSLTEGVDAKDRIGVIAQSVVTAICLAIAFIFLGKAVFSILKITVGDFMVAGGIILFCIAIIDIINPDKKRRIPSSQMGAVPLGTPLIVGPAVLTTCLIIIDEFGITATLLAVIINIMLAAMIFLSSGFLIKIMGVSGTRALSKIMSLLLAAIAVMMVRKGILQILS
ncbi:MAG: MarC family protein [Candidatus Omnitrophota bacterium]